MAFTPTTDATDDAIVPGSLGITLNEFTRAWNGADDSYAPLKGKWKLSKSGNGKTAEHYWSNPDNEAFGLIGVVAPNGELVSMSLVFAPSAASGSLEAGLQALDMLLMMSSLIDATSRLPQDTRIELMNALDPYDLEPTDFLDVNRAAVADGFYARMGQTPTGSAAVLVVREANIPLPAPSSTPSPSPSPSPSSSESPSSSPSVVAGYVTRSGNGTGQSLKFSLESGDYRADWTASDPGASGIGCFNGLSLVSAEPSYRGTISSVDVTGTQSATNYLNDVPAGDDFYVDANSGCDWSVTLTQL